jgi:hypothetical protein
MFPTFYPLLGDLQTFTLIVKKIGYDVKFMFIILYDLINLRKNLAHKGNNKDDVFQKIFQMVTRIS